jgi:fido (protein-threonine AMPylation protein)
MLGTGFSLSDCQFHGVHGQPVASVGELNAAHPFREGNGRTQRKFIRATTAEEIT